MNLANYLTLITETILPFTGLRVVYDLSQPEGSRVAEVSVVCLACDVPDYRPLEPNATYPILTNSYLLGGGDGYAVLRDNILKRELIGLCTYVSSSSSNLFFKSSSTFPYVTNGRQWFPPRCSNRWRSSFLRQDEVANISRARRSNHVQTPPTGIWRWR